MTAITYNEYTNAIRRLAVAPTDKQDTDFEAMWPHIINYAELRIYREFDFLNTRTANATASTASGSRDVTVPSSLIVVESVNLITPVATAPDAGTRNPLQRVSLDFLNTIWPTVATTGTPSKWALLTDTSLRLAPTPAGIYTLECIGTTRPTALSPSNTSTFITTYMPDLFISASMIFVASYRQNYGAASDDPKMAQSYEAQYQLQKAGVMVEELRKKYESWGWSAGQPSSIANMSRNAGSVAGNA